MKKCTAKINNWLVAKQSSEKFPKFSVRLNRYWFIFVKIYICGQICFSADPFMQQYFESPPSSEFADCHLRRVTDWLCVRTSCNHTSKILNYPLNSWGTAIITRNTVILRGKPKAETIFYPKSALNKDKKQNYEIGSCFKKFSLFPLNPSPLISPLLPFYLPLSPSAASCTSACFISETINDGLCVRCRRWHWTSS